MIYPLEPRRLLSFSFNGTILNVVGTNNADTITIKVVGKELVVSLSGDAIQTNAATVSSVSVDAAAGPDTITATLKLPILVHGGKGDDTITGGEGNDTLFGDGGSNNISGGSGDDTIHAGLQADT